MIANIRSHLSAFGWKIINDWSFSLSSLIAYYLLISLLPILLSVFSVTIVLFGNDEQILNSTLNRLIQSFPNEEFDNVIISLAKSISKQAVSVFIISFIVSIFTASRLFIGIDDVLTIIYRTRERRILNQNLHAIKMLLVFIFFMPIIIISASVPVFLKKNQTVYHFFTTLITGLFAFILFNLIFYFVPQRRMYWSKIWCGSLIAAIGLQILILLFPAYVKLLMADYVGQMGFIIIILLLFYIVSLLLVIGAQINAYFFEHIQPLSNSLGNYICESADQENIRLIEADNHISTLMEAFDPSR